MGTSNQSPQTPLGNNASLPHPQKGKKIWVVTAVLLVLLAAVAAAVLYFAKRGHHGELESSAPAQPAPASVAADPNTLSLSLPESETAQAFEGALRLLEKAPTETYDVSAAAKLLGDDIDKNFAFVRDNFAFDPYVGCLRGAQGTLMTGAGNDVDRSLLLAALLKNSGHDVRLARGTLSDTDAARLLARAQQPPVPRPSSDLSVEEAAAITGLPAAELQKLSARAKSIAQEVGQNLDARVQTTSISFSRSSRGPAFISSPAPVSRPMRCAVTCGCKCKWKVPGRISILRSPTRRSASALPNPKGTPSRRTPSLMTGTRPCAFASCRLGPAPATLMKYLTTNSVSPTWWRSRSISFLHHRIVMTRLQPTPFNPRCSRGRTDTPVPTSSSVPQKRLATLRAGCSAGWGAEVKKKRGKKVRSLYPKF